MATKEENRPYKKGDVSYTEEEIAVMAIQAKYLTTALLQPIIGAIGALAFFLNPAMEQKVLKELPKMIEDRYLEAISNDPKVSEAHADQFVEVLKELLNSR